MYSSLDVHFTAVLHVLGQSLGRPGELSVTSYPVVFDELSEAKEQLKHISAKYEGRLA